MQLSKTIFLVDDDPDDRLLISEAIHSVIKAVRIVEIQSGIDLLNILSSQPGQVPDLILLDMNMPGINGLETLSQLREKPSQRCFPIIMLSTACNNDLVKQAYMLGVNAFMPKPITSGHYRAVARAVNLCFLNHIDSTPPNLSVSETEKETSLIVIEDNEDHWNLIDMAIRQKKHHLKLIRLRDKSSTLEFLDSCYKRLAPYPKLILLDLYMPTKKDGLSILDSIRYFISVNNLPQVPVFVFTFSDHHQDIDACYARQANAVITKPTDLTHWPLLFADLLDLWGQTVRLPNNQMA